MNQFDVGMYMIDRDYRMLYINQAAKKMYPQVKEGDICYQVLACFDKPCATCPIGKQESLFYNPNRKEWIAAQAAQMQIPQYGQCQCIQFMLKRRGVSISGEQLSKEQVQKLISEIGASQGNECIIGGYCEDGFPLFYINEKMIELLGYNSQEEMMKTVDGLVANFIHPDDLEQVRADMGGRYYPGMTFETVCRVPKKDGAWIWIAAKGKTIQTESGRLALMGICVDLSSVLKRQNALREQYESLQRRDSVIAALMNNMPGGYHRCGIDDGFPLSYVSDSFLEVVGWSREDLESVLHNRYLNMVAPEDRELFLSLEPKLRQEGKINCVYRIWRKDGSRRWVQDSTQYVEKDGQRYFQCAIADITDFVEGIHDQKRQLEEAMHRIEAVSKAKSAFLFNVSHDVRTPMNAIQGYTHIIEEQPEDTELVRDMIGKIHKSSDTLMQLLNDVLELSRIESGKDEIEKGKVDLNVFLEKLYAMFIQEMEDSGISFRLETSIQDPVVLCDELKCTRILMNMLSNARKFTAPGGSVVLGVVQEETDRPGEGTYRFYVRDTGIGMSTEFQERAFEEFERERTSTDSGIGGSGLGMAIIKRLTSLMGGSCMLSSKLGEGTEISVRFQFVQEQPEQENCGQCACKTVNFTGKRVLLVEDNAFNREIARYILNNMGLAVEEAEDGAVAVNRILQASRYHYDLILMDVQMPVMDGYTATQEIRRMKDPIRRSIPIIAMTANAFKEDRERCMEVGMNGHMGKPIDAKILAQTLSQYL